MYVVAATLRSLKMVVKRCSGCGWVLDVEPHCVDAWYQKGYGHYHLKQFSRSVCP